MGRAVTSIASPSRAGFAPAGGRSSRVGRQEVLRSLEARTRLQPYAYHRELLPAESAARAEKSLKVHDFVCSIDAASGPAPDPSTFRNVNTSAVWTALQTEEVRA